MKKIKNLCLIAALGVMVTGGSLLQVAPAYAATTINVSASGTSLANAVKQAKSGDTINIIGTVTSSTINVPDGVIITGKSGAGKVNFSPTGITGKGFVVNGTGSTITDLEIYNAGDNGVYVQGSSNNLTNLEVHNNNDAGVQLSNGAARNTLTSVHSYSNCDQFGKTDPKKRGENADGFAVKLGSGEGNKLIKCVSEGNSDDGYDLYAAHGVVTFEGCSAINNGSFKTAKGEIIYGDGNGFKVGGIDNKTDPSHPVAVAENHKLTNCTATGNLGAGFDRNNQTGVVTMTGCVAQNNTLGNYNFPLTGTPSALGHQVTFGVAQIISCKSLGSSNTKDKLDGAQVSKDSIGFINPSYTGK
jgi:parallel beta-helix repeat protein